MLRWPAICGNRLNAVSKRPRGFATRIWTDSSARPHRRRQPVVTTARGPECRAAARHCAGQERFDRRRGPLRRPPATRSFSAFGHSLYSRSPDRTRAKTVMAKCAVSLSDLRRSLTNIYRSERASFLTFHKLPLTAGIDRSACTKPTALCRAFTCRPHRECGPESG